MPSTFRKTAKGQAEVETRAWRLAPRLRSLLILVDGRRDVTALSALVQQPADTVLAALAEQGFIEAVADAVSARPAAVPAATVRPAPAAVHAQVQVQRATSLARVARTAAPIVAPSDSTFGSFSDSRFGAFTDSRFCGAGDSRFDSHRQEAVQALHAEIGADGQPLAERMAHAASPDELRPLLAQAAQLVASLRGRPAAAVYAMRFLAG